MSLYIASVTNSRGAAFRKLAWSHYSSEFDIRSRIEENKVALERVAPIGLLDDAFQ